MLVPESHSNSLIVPSNTLKESKDEDIVETHRGEYDTA